MVNPKTIIDWINLLPSPHKQLALKYTNFEDFHVPADNMLSALGRAFNWSSTLQGFDYWATIATRSYVENRPTLNFEDLQKLVSEWGANKGINNAANQYIKTIEELGELGRAILTNNEEEEIDAFGDVMVCLIILASIRNKNLVSCLNSAYNVIKNRTGKTTESGVFIKSEDNANEKI
jgi:NTP pyrophosphatase (non-canonical NTP hydrolase)